MSGHDVRLNLLWLLVQGGAFMIPIGLMSVLAIAAAIDRLLGLRRARTLPDPLVAGLQRMSRLEGSFDPREAYQLCLQYPSAAASVVRAMLLKVGRPHGEVEHAIGQALQREADVAYRNVRWLNLAAAVTPLIGLMGTVWGMILSFHHTTQLAPAMSRTTELAGGIYVALVTTLGGLAVAIPAAIVSHFFEGRIQTLFHQIDELLVNLMPQIEDYEGRRRFGSESPVGSAAASPAGYRAKEN